MLYSHLMFLEIFFNQKLFQFHMFSTLRTLVLFREENNDSIVTINFQRPDYTIDLSQSWIKCRSYLFWIVASKHAKNSSSTVDASSIDCFILFHVISLPSNKNKYPNVDFSFIHGTNIIWISNHIKMIIYSISKHIFFSSL